MNEQNNEGFDLKSYLKAHEGVQDHGDGTLSAQIWMSDATTAENLQAQLNAIAQAADGGMRFTVVPCPDFTVDDLVDDSGSFHHNPDILIPQEDWEGKIQFYLQMLDGEQCIWEPAIAEQLEVTGSLLPRICVEHGKHGHDELHVTAVFGNGSVVELANGFADHEPSPILFVLDSSTGFGFPVNPDSVLCWRHEESGEYRLDEVHVHNRQHYLDQLMQFGDLADPTLPLDERKADELIARCEETLRRAFNGSDVNA